MRLRPKILRPMLRSLAAVTLMAWVGAVVLCQVHCLFAASQDKANDTGCCAAAGAASHHGMASHGTLPSRHAHCPEASCLTLKTALAAHGISFLAVPQFSLLYTIAPFAMMSDTMATEPVASFSRHARPREWVFTPVVCLGPAFRSHAPPVHL